VIAGEARHADTGDAGEYAKMSGVTGQELDEDTHRCASHGALSLHPHSCATSWWTGLFSAFMRCSGLVLRSELLSVNHATDVRRFLMEKTSGRSGSSPFVACAHDASKMLGLGSRAANAVTSADNRQGSAVPPCDLVALKPPSQHLEASEPWSCGQQDSDNRGAQVTLFGSYQGAGS
jgi:hypothetical protein